MERDYKIVALYRVTEKEIKDKEGVHGKKEKPDYITNAICLKNFKKSFDGKLVVFGDRLNESRGLVTELADEYIDIQTPGNSTSFIQALDYALELDEETIVYFVEDDYLHRPNISSYLKEGLERFNYLSLYDHPDKHGNQQTQVFATSSTHWMLTGSTTMTFATTVRTLYFDHEEIRKWLKTSQPNDFYMWQSLLKSGRTLGTPIPSISTHGETKWLAPFINWKDYANA